MKSLYYGFRLLILYIVGDDAYLYENSANMIEVGNYGYHFITCNDSMNSVTFNSIRFFEIS